MELAKEIVLMVVYAVITGCSVVVVKKLLNAANAKIDELQTNTKLSEYDQLNVWINQAQAVVTTIVQSINQTFVEDLKNSGSFTAESAKQAKDLAIQKANELITEEGAKAIEQMYGDVNTYLDLLVEQTVNKLKNK